MEGRRRDLSTCCDCVNEYCVNRMDKLYFTMLLIMATVMWLMFS